MGAQTLFAAILLGRVMPALDPVLSPAALATLMQPAIAAGYPPAVAHGIPGVSHPPDSIRHGLTGLDFSPCYAMPLL